MNDYDFLRKPLFLAAALKTNLDNPETVKAILEVALNNIQRDWKDYSKEYNSFEDFINAGNLEGH